MLKQRQIAVRDAIIDNGDDRKRKRLAPLFKGDPKHNTALIGLHRHHFMTTMTDALATSYPVVQRLVSEASFAVLCRHFIADHPPKTPCLFDYGDEFGDFLADFAKNDPYLADVARLENAIRKVAHASDHPTCTPAALSGMNADDLGATRLPLHPSIQRMTSPWAVFEIWNNNQCDDVPQTPLHAPSGTQHLIVVRQKELTQKESGPGLTPECRPDKVEILKCGSDIATFLDALADGGTLGQAGEKAIAHNSTFNLVENFAFLLSNGVFTMPETHAPKT